MNGVVSFLAGVVFAVGLCLSGMTQPAKVTGFLDVSRIPSGGWDPSLAFVMMGAIAVHFVFARRARLGRAPLLAATNDLPTARRLDARLFAGAALFGLGWGIAGFCPGPAVVAVVTAATPTLVFVAAMVAGMVVHALTRRGRSAADQAPTRTSPPLTSSTR